ncbi:hypothetical protein GCM10020254_61410 [Streptomyces goshikiensis]
MSAAARAALDWARLLTAAQCLGVGEALLARTVAYAKVRTQFGAPIGSFQAVKHRLADTLLALEFARPLLFAAALSLDPGEVAAAKLAAGGGGVRGGADRAPAARCDRLHGGAGPLPVAAQGAAAAGRVGRAGGVPGGGPGRPALTPLPDPA